MAGHDTVNAGFLPLTDCMILVIAHEKGFAEKHGIDLRLSKAMSWASIRDYIAVGQLDVAQMLAPMPIAFNTGLSEFSAPVIAPMALGLGGNAVTVSTAVWSQLTENSGGKIHESPSSAGQALKELTKKRESKKETKLRLAVVHPFSSHNLELRYWLSSCGIDPQTDLDVLVVPPPLMPDALKNNQIDGYCVGEPWNSVAVEKGIGRILTTKSEIWHSSPEKVLGVRTDWADQNPDIMQRLLTALLEASEWCSLETNHVELSTILGEPDYIGVDPDVIRRGLAGEIYPSETGHGPVDDFLVPFERAATFPWQSHALWFYSQMVRWGLLKHSKENTEIAKGSYRPDIYRKALLETGASIPAANMKVEGALKSETAVGSTGRLTLGPDGFFDGKIFDPDEVDAYIASFSR